MDEDIIAFTCTTIARSNIYQTVERVIDLFITHSIICSFRFCVPSSSFFIFEKIVAVRWKFILHMIYSLCSHFVVGEPERTTSCVLHLKLMNVCECVCVLVDLTVEVWKSTSNCMGNNCYRQTETINFTNCTKYVPLCVLSLDSADALCVTLPFACKCVRLHTLFSGFSISRTVSLRSLGQPILKSI